MDVDDANDSCISNKRTNRQTNNNDYISSSAAVKIGLKLSEKEKH